MFVLHFDMSLGSFSYNRDIYVYLHIVTIECISFSESLAGRQGFPIQFADIFSYPLGKQSWMTPFHCNS